MHVIKPMVTNMNVLQQSTRDIDHLNHLMCLSAAARDAFEQRRSTPPSHDRTAKHTLFAKGKGMWQIINTSTNKVVGFRQSHKEAVQLAQRLERIAAPAIE